MADEQPKPINAFLAMMVEQAITFAKNDETGERGASLLEQRICIGLVQARALECRTLAGMLLIGGAASQQGPAGKMAMMISMKMRERSHRLEMMGMKLAECWPPTGEDFAPGDDPRVELM